MESLKSKSKLLIALMLAVALAITGVGYALANPNDGAIYLDKYETYAKALTGETSNGAPNSMPGWQRYEISNQYGNTTGETFLDISDELEGVELDHITFMPNSENYTGSMEQQTYSIELGSITRLYANKYVKPGHDFVGWTTEPVNTTFGSNLNALEIELSLKAEGKKLYKNNGLISETDFDELQLPESLTLYAVWQKHVYNIEINNTNGGVVKYNNQAAQDSQLIRAQEYGTNVDLSAYSFIPNEGFALDGFLVTTQERGEDPVSKTVAVDQINNLVVEGNTIITPVFKEDEITNTPVYAYSFPVTVSTFYATEDYKFYGFAEDFTIEVGTNEQSQIINVPVSDLLEKLNNAVPSGYKIKTISDGNSGEVIEADDVLPIYVWGSPVNNNLKLSFELTIEEITEPENPNIADEDETLAAFNFSFKATGIQSTGFNDYHEAFAALNN